MCTKGGEEMSEPAGKTALKPVYGWLPLVYFVIQVIVGVWLAFWLLYNHQPQTGDDIEHLHSAWLVHEGKIPYIDFFSITIRCYGICFRL